MLNYLKRKKIKIGILGGSFDPAHIGHVKISTEAKKKYKLKYILWLITEKNPFKKKCKYSIKERIKFSKKINKNKKFIKIQFLETKIKIVSVEARQLTQIILSANHPPSTICEI